MTIDIEPTANFLEVEGVSDFNVIKETIQSALYDLDDVDIEDLDVTRRLDEIYNEDLQSGSRKINYNRA
jgi:hypothetical protein|tara:strand:- start:215 stop:421 length:207 start_codon:yes stop_codon:yes gene_type:complete